VARLAFSFTILAPSSWQALSFSIALAYSSFLLRRSAEDAAASDDVLAAARASPVIRRNARACRANSSASTNFSHSGRARSAYAA
jgi:hypothetical protein